jgi:TPR repeat protein
MRRPAAAFILIISLLVCCSDNRGTIEDAEKAYNSGDFHTAYRVYKPLAEQGNARAQFNIGMMYESGRGVPQNYAEMMKWYRKAAEQGHALAQFNLGLQYSKGQGVQRDYAEGVKWYRKAADQGDVDAMGNLGYMYLNGLGVPRDNVLAHMWSNLATMQFPASEQRKRQIAEGNMDIAASKMTPAQIAEAQKLAREWKPKKEK